MLVKIETYADLKAALEPLTDEQLNQPVKYWGEEKAGNIEALELLDENYYNVSGECLEPASFYEDAALVGEIPVKLKGELLIVVE